MDFNAFHRALDFKGRSSRKEFWIYSILVSALMAFVFTIASENSDYRMLVYVFIIVFSIPTLSVSVRRLHDIGASGALALLPPCIQLVKVVVDRVSSNEDLQTILTVLQWVANLFLLALYCIPSHGDNKYGPDPTK